MKSKGNPCLLLFNDIHISKDNIPEFVANWDEALEICERNGIKEIALGGDMFHSRASQTLDVLLTVRESLLKVYRKGLHITIAEGNHCLVNQEALHGYNHVFDQYPNVTVVDDFLLLENPDWDFVLHIMSYFPENGSFSGRLNALVQGSLVGERLNYLYIHEGINGALAHSSENELPAHIFGDFDHTFVGHYHNRTVIEGTNIEYIGSSRQHNFGEDEQKGYTVLFTDGSHEFIQNKANTRYRVIDVEVSQVGTHLNDLLDEIRQDKRYKVKVRVHGTPEQVAAIDKSVLLDAGATKVELTSEIVTPGDDDTQGDLFEKYDRHKITESYQDFCVRKNVKDVDLGLSYLSKIDAVCGN